MRLVVISSLRCGNETQCSRKRKENEKNIHQQKDAGPPIEIGLVLRNAIIIPKLTSKNKEKECNVIRHEGAGQCAEYRVHCHHADRVQGDVETIEQSALINDDDNDQKPDSPSITAVLVGERGDQTWKKGSKNYARVCPNSFEPDPDLWEERRPHSQTIRLALGAAFPELDTPHENKWNQQESPSKEVIPSNEDPESLDRSPGKEDVEDEGWILVDIVIGRAKQVVGQYLHEGIAELKGFGALCETPDCMKLYKDLDKSKKQVQESEMSEALTRWYSQTCLLDELIVIQNEVRLVVMMAGG
ncbi:hypothetical protein BDZ89DRAFT_1182468 [Hymenopellis radicata]|nr:hypothetical protein BDZ89DRAFT_1182468 [Hymenopellis radicata]